MTGGGALLHGLDKLIMERTGIKARIVDDPVSSVAIGTGKALDWVNLLESEIISSDSIRTNY